MPVEPAGATSLFLDLFRIRPVRPDLRLLGEVSLNFSALPWENLTKFIKKHRLADETGKLRRSLEVLEDHARFGAGGTCFSLTNALRRIAVDLGYRAYPVMADMRHGPNVHCGLLVELDGGRYLLDPGYLVPEPVPLREGETVHVGLAGQRLEYRPVAGGNEVDLYTINERDEEIFRYRLRPRPVPEAGFIRFWIESFEASGMNGLHLNRVASEGRLSAHNFNLRVDTGRRKQNIKLRDGYVEKISHRFGLDRSLVGEAFGAWERLRCREE